MIQLNILELAKQGDTNVIYLQSNNLNIAVNIFTKGDRHLYTKMRSPVC